MESSATGMRRSPSGPASVTSAPMAISTGAVSAEATAQQRRAARRHPAGGAVLLHAEVDRLPPLPVLIVVVAAGVEAEVAAQRPHVAQRRRGDQLRRPAPAPARRRRSRGRSRCASARSSRPSANFEPSFDFSNSGSILRRPITRRGVCWRRFMLGNRSVPPATTSPRGPWSAKQPHRLGDLPRREVLEARQPHHGRCPPRRAQLARRAAPPWRPGPRRACAASR